MALLRTPGAAEHKHVCVASADGNDVGDPKKPVDEREIQVAELTVLFGAVDDADANLAHKVPPAEPLAKKRKFQIRIYAEKTQSNSKKKATARVRLRVMAGWHQGPPGRCSGLLAILLSNLEAKLEAAKYTGWPHWRGGPCCILHRRLSSPLVND